MGFYDLSVTAPDGSQVAMADFKGKVVLVVNTATGCGFTPHYAPLEAMYEKYHDQGFEIVDVPCNQFKGQTPGTDEEIHQFCTLKYNTQFPQMKKSDVNGENAIELFKYLKSQKGFEGFGKGPAALAMSALLKTIDKDYKNNPAWLCDEEATVREIYQEYLTLSYDEAVHALSGDADNMAVTIYY